LVAWDLRMMRKDRKIDGKLPSTLVAAVGTD
jgi:hypothetical protein